MDTSSNVGSCGPPSLVRPRSLHLSRTHTFHVAYPIWCALHISKIRSFHLSRMHTFMVNSNTSFLKHPMVFLLNQGAALPGFLARCPHAEDHSDGTLRIATWTHSMLRAGRRALCTHAHHRIRLQRRGAAGSRVSPAVGVLRCTSLSHRCR